MAIFKADFIEGIAKGMAVMESFDTERQRLNATLTAERAGLTRAAARRHLLTLAELGYLETDGSYFWLSSKVLRFSGSYLASSRLPRAIQPALDRLAFQTREAFSAAVLDGDHVVVIARSAGASNSVSGVGGRMMAYGVHLGARLPAHATSTGRVLLANLARKHFNVWMKARLLSRLTSRTITDAHAFRSIIAQVRDDDFCLASEEHELGVRALAVPLRDSSGITLAALNVIVSPMRQSAAVLQRDLLPLLREAAQEVRLTI